MHFKDEYVCRYLYDAEPFTSIDEAKQLISVLGNKDNEDINRWIIMDKATKIRMGTCGYMFWDKCNNSIEIGFDLQNAYSSENVQ
jgi:ribosomal-protein-alanine N-acetyltransferase